MDYQPRVVDQLLSELVSGLPAVAVEGAKGVGKTASAGRLAASVLELDNEALRTNVAAQPSLVTRYAPPTLIDEWQLVPTVWDVVRREVDRDRVPGRFIMTGSASPADGARTHSGAGRIVRLVMRPMTLPERGVSTPTVSFTDLLTGAKPDVEGSTAIDLVDYTAEILASGLPGVRQDAIRWRARQLDSYIDEALDIEIPALGVNVRRPQALRAWLAAYASATATTTNYTAILNAATPGEADKISKPTAAAYRALLERIRLLDPLPAWIPSMNSMARLGQAPKHHLVDPALAAVLLGATQESLLDGSVAGPVPRDGTLLGALFESLAVLTIRVFAEPSGVRVSHLRTNDNEHEVDVIVETPDHRVLAIEVKLSSAVRRDDVKHLNWLESQIGDRLIGKVLINTGAIAHRLPDGTAVVPLALLGP